jgi:hypothetical protein
MNAFLDKLNHLFPADHKSLSTYLKFASYFVLFILFLLAFYRAATLSMTHDESATWLYVQDNNILATLFDRSAWGTANNHFLNSLFIEFNTSIFGDSELAIRIHSILAFLVYGLSGMYLIRSVYRTTAASLLAFGLLFMNLYLFDFFSLARGYALSVSLHMVALAYLYHWIKTRKTSSLWMIYLFLGLASLALFTHLIFIPVYTGAIWLYVLKNQRNKSSSISRKVWLIPIISAALISMLAYIPVTTLSGNSEFLWGTESLLQSISILIDDSLHARLYFGGHSLKIILGTMALLVISGVMVYKSHKKEKQHSPEDKFFAMLLLMVVLTILAMVASKLLLGTLYPINRKSTMYLPLIGLLLPYGLEWVHLRKTTSSISVVITILMTTHFFDKMELDRTREWYYDFQTNQYIKAIGELSQGEQITVGNHWSFHWTSMYYLKKYDLDEITLTKYQEQPDLINPPDYFIIHHQDLPLFDHQYYVIKGPNYSMVSLLRRKQ